MAVKFEDKLKKLEEIIESLEAGPEDLEEAIKTFESGMKLSRQCHLELDKAQKRVELLLKNEQGEFEIKQIDD